MCWIIEILVKTNVLWIGKNLVWLILKRGRDFDGDEVGIYIGVRLWRIYSLCWDNSVLSN